MGKQHEHPFDCCDVVTTTTHKSLRGPRSGMIFFKYDGKFPDIKERIDMAVFPALQGGPHNHQIGALATQLLEVKTEEFVAYSKEVIVNAKALAKALMDKGHKLASVALTTTLSCGMCDHTDLQAARSRRFARRLPSHSIEMRFTEMLPLSRLVVCASAVRQ